MPNRATLEAWKAVMDAWTETKKAEENKDWVGSVSAYSYIGLRCVVEMGLYDSVGDRVAGRNRSADFSYSSNSSFRLQAQVKYFDQKNYEAVTFGPVAFDDIIGAVTPKMERVSVDSTYLQVPVMTVAEYEAWVVGR